MLHWYTISLCHVLFLQSHYIYTYSSSDLDTIFISIDPTKIACAWSFNIFIEGQFMVCLLFVYGMNLNDIHANVSKCDKSKYFWLSLYIATLVFFSYRPFNTHHFSCFGFYLTVSFIKL
ncbi:hypothetical protein ABZP36_014072 [Zizania latifolia]